MEVKMHKIFLMVSMCIFALTHHLPKISAIASDLSSFPTSSLPSLSLSSSASTSSNAAAAMADVQIPQSGGGGDVGAKTVAIAYEENKAPAKEISITASSSKIAEKNLATRRQTRSLFYPYAGGLYSNFYIGYGSSASYYYPSAYSYAYYPTYYKYWGVYNPYYGYQRVISG